MALKIRVLDREKKDKADRLSQCVHDAKMAIRDGKKAYLLLGKSLYPIKAENLWKEDGSGARNFREWVENELAISKSNAYHAIDAYIKVGEILENNADFNDLDYSKVIMLLPHIGEKMSVAEKEEMLHMAMNCPMKALKDNLAERSGRIPTDVCEHGDTELWNRCLNCGKFFR